MNISDRDIQSALHHKDQVRAELDLYEFAKQAWHVLEEETPMVDGWAMRAIADHLQAVTEGHITRLLINVPPGFMKSMLTNVFWPAWEWGPKKRPGLRYISASYGEDLSIRHMIRGRDLLMSEWYQSRWPLKFKDDVNEKTLYGTVQMGWRRAVGVRGSIMGYRGDRIIIDDPHDIKAAESPIVRAETSRWFGEGIPSRLNNAKTSAIVMIMQRLHTLDLSGFILDDPEIAQEWTHLMIPMEYEEDRKCRTSVICSRTGKPWEDPRTVEGESAWPGRFPLKEIEKAKAIYRKESGTYVEEGQFQQRPAPRGGGMFKVDNFIMTHKTPEGGTVVRGWDLAASTGAKAAWTVGVKLHRSNDGYVTILDVIRFQGSPHEVNMKMRQAAEMDGPQVVIDIPQDPGAAGKTVVSTMVLNLEGFKVRYSPESGDKVLRAEPFAAQVEAGHVSMLVRPWNKDYIEEASLFPAGKWMDQIDATSRAYAQLIKHKRARISLVAPTLITG